MSATRWGRAGLESGDWIMKGGKTTANYRLSGKFQEGFGNQSATFSSGTTYQVPAGSLYPPRGLNPIDGRIKSLVPGQRRYYPDGVGLVTHGEVGLFNGIRAFTGFK